MAWTGEGRDTIIWNDTLKVTKNLFVPMIYVKGGTIQNTPTNAKDIVNKEYVDGIAISRLHNELGNLAWSVAGHTIDEDLDMNSHKITELVDPVNNQEAATKKYVDDNAGGGGITNLDGGDADEDFGGVAISPIDGGDST